MLMFWISTMLDDKIKMILREGQQIWNIRLYFHLTRINFRIISFNNFFVYGLKNMCKFSQNFTKITVNEPSLSVSILICCKYQKIRNSEVYLGFCQTNVVNFFCERSFEIECVLTGLLKSSYFKTFLKAV